MNSDEEKKLLESNGWEYNYVKREWRSPTGAFAITQDELMKYTTTEQGEQELRNLLHKLRYVG